MNVHSPGFRRNGVIGLFIVAAVALALVASGCAPSQETTEGGAEATGGEQQVTPAAPTNPEVDSLNAVIRQMQDQLTQCQTDTRNLTAKVAEQETKLAEAAAAATTQKPAAAPASASSAADAKSAYAAALDQFNKKNYADAAAQFDALLKGGVADELAGHCHYWTGESYYGMKKYEDALKEFQATLDYKTSPKKASAQYMIARCYARLGDPAAAKEAYNKVVSDYPLSSLVAKAQESLAKMK